MVHVFHSWMLERITDLNGNTISYDYTATSGVLHLNEISYTHSSASASDGSYSIEIDYESRPDQRLTYERGFSTRSYSEDFGNPR